MQDALKKVSKILADHEKRIKLLEGSKKIKEKDDKSWYRPGTTIDKVMSLLKEGFFKRPKSVSEILSELKNKDYHLKAPDLTLPLRKIVRRQILRKTDKFSDGTISSKWLYIEAK